MGEIGSGESYTAIDTVLQTIAHQSWPIPAELITKLTNWLDVYAQSDDAPRLHELHAIKSLDQEEDTRHSAAIWRSRTCSA
jgi:hypothetical protein